MPDMSRHTPWVILLILISFLFLMFGNNLVSLTHPDEVFYAQTAKEMIEHDSWLVPYIFDEPQFEKPIFFYFILALAFKLFGISPFVARFWPALFAMAGILVTYWLGHLMFQNKRAAFFSGVILSTSFIYLALSRAVMTDMVFSVMVFCSIALFYWAYIRPERKNVGIIASLFVAALAVLTKGVLGIIFPAGVILLFLLYKKDCQFLRCWGTPAGLLLFLAVALPWHIYMYRLFGQGFIDEYWHNVHVRRIFDAEHQKSNTWYFYPLTMFGGVFPWSVFLIPAVFFLIRDKDFRDRHADAFVFLGITIIFVWALMQIAASKLASYIFPVFPAIALILGYYWQRMDKKALWAKWGRICGYLMGIFLVLGSGAAVYFGNVYREYAGNMTYVYIVAVLLLACGAAVLVSMNKGRRALAMTSLAGVTAVVLCFAFLGRQYAEPWVSCLDVSRKFEKIDHSDSVVLCAKFYVRGVRYYTDRETAVIDINGSGFFSPHPIPFLNTHKKVDDFLKKQDVTYGVLKESNVKDLRRITKGRYDMTILDEMGGKYIVRIEKASVPETSSRDGK